MTSARSATIRVPASTSNLGAGFDCIGVAVDRWLTVTAEIGAHGPDTRISRRGTLAGLPAREDDDAILIGFRAACTAAGREPPGALCIDADSRIPVGRGLGSSAAAVVAGAALADALLALGFDRHAIAAIGTSVEGHPDNVCPAVYGGATLALAHDGALVLGALEIDASLAFVFAIPDLTVETSRARAALPASVPHATAVRAAAKSAALVHGLATGDGPLLAAALDDVLHVPYRRTLVRGYDAIVAAACTAGAFGATLSGSGSSIVAISPTDVAGRVGDAMALAWRERGTGVETLISMRPARGYELAVRR